MAKKEEIPVLEVRNESTVEADVGEAGKIPVGLSACLAGYEVRYNGGHSQSRLCLRTLSEFFTFRTFCPEVAAGFGIPRPTMRLSGSPEAPRLTLSDDASVDLTDQLMDAVNPKLDEFDGLDGYILMKNSPSCGMERVKIYRDNGYPYDEKGSGFFAAALMEKYPLLPVEEEGRLHDARLLENFVLRVYAHHNFRQEVLAEPSHHKLIQFHSSYKYVLMAHHQQSPRDLGHLLADAGKQPLDTLVQEYFEAFMEAIRKPASTRNHTNTLMHILGYLKKDVPAPARQNILDTIHRYRQAEVPLVVPLTLLSHYIDQAGSDYIRAQRYLQPYPQSLGLTNAI